MIQQADVISMSVGVAGGFIDNPLARLGDRLVENGVVVVISAGNDGYDGPINVNEYCAGRSYLCVASVESVVKAGDPVDFVFEVNGTSNKVQIGHIAPGKYSVEIPAEGFNVGDSMGPYTEIWGKPVTVVSVGDACAKITPIDGPLTETVLLVSQTNCVMEEKVKNLMELNPSYVLFYEDGVQGLWLRRGLFPTTSVAVGYGIIEKDAGEAIIATFNAGGKVTATFNQNKKGFVVPAKHSRGGLANMYSSWGGAYDLTLKPDVAGPGGEIYSSWAEGNPDPPFEFVASWHVYNGTSMAAPYVAGAAALYLSKHGGRSKSGNGIAKKAIESIRASGRNVPWGMEPFSDPDVRIDPPNPNPIPKGAVAPVTHVGSGLLNAFNAVNYRTSISSASISLNDTANFKGTHEIVITNGGSEAVTYEFSHDKQLGVEGRTTKTTIADYTEFKMSEISPEITFPAAGFSVGAGQSKTAT
jgi:subtilisin family serine protease